jgi:hypothetical protein
MEASADPNVASLISAAEQVTGLRPKRCLKRCTLSYTALRGASWRDMAFP